MSKHFVRTALLLVLTMAGTAQAGPIGWQQPYFTYSPGAVDFEDIAWTPLDLAAFNAYGGYFANVRRPRPGNPVPDPFLAVVDHGFEDEVLIQAKTPVVPTFLPVGAVFEPFTLTPFANDPDPDPNAPVPEPGTLALVGIGLLAASRTVRRAFSR